MEIKTLTLGELATNCYIVISAAGNAAMIDLRTMHSVFLIRSERKTPSLK